MELTWQSNHLPKLDVLRLEAGDVAVCGTLADRAALLAQLDPERVAFVAPLGSRSDLEWLLRGLLLHPNIRHLVLCGDDGKAAGAALVALWKEGLDGNGRIAGPRGRLCAALDAASVDTLRHNVRISDWRGRPAVEIAEGIADLPVLSRETEPRALPNPEVPERKVFLSRKTTFPIYSGCAGDAWLQLLNLALRIGTEKQADDGERLAEALNAVVTIGLPVIAEDLEVEGYEVPGEFPSFLDFNQDDFERCFRLDVWSGIDQLAGVCDRLRKSPDTSSGTVVLLERNDLGHPQTAPNLVSATFNTVEGKLYGSFVLRSADLYTDWPLEAMALVRVQREVAGRLGLGVGASTFVIHSAHLYARDWDRAQQVLDESFKRPLPLQVDHSGIFLFGNDGGQARAMLLDHDAATIYWEEAFGTTDELSWYIVDAMPWLLPQHIRYVGQECSTLKRAMREGECYEQG